MRRYLLALVGCCCALTILAACEGDSEEAAPRAEADASAGDNVVAEEDDDASPAVVPCHSKDPGAPPTGACELAALRTDDDPCLKYGLACSFDPFFSVGGCDVPHELDACDPTICNACGDGMDCVAGAPGAPTGLRTMGQCVRRCETTNDCSSLLTQCVPVGDGPSHCFQNVCEEYGGACPVAGEADGQCLPYGVVDSSGRTSKPIGYCAATGKANVDDSCTTQRTDGDDSTVCAFGLSCFPYSMRCRSVCSLSGVSNCDGACFAAATTLEVYEPPRLGLFGLCLSSCDPLGPPCPFGQECLAVSDSDPRPACF